MMNTRALNKYIASNAWINPMMSGLTQPLIGWNLAIDLPEFSP